MHFKNERQENKTGPARGWILVGGGWMEKVKEGEYTLHIYMKIEQWNLLKLF
jgi:hypothetical protein